MTDHSHIGGDPDVTFAQCRACGCMTLDTPAGLLNPQRQPLGPYTKTGALSAEHRGHFLHRCPPKKAS